VINNSRKSTPTNVTTTSIIASSKCATSVLKFSYYSLASAGSLQCDEFIVIHTPVISTFITFSTPHAIYTQRSPVIEHETPTTHPWHIVKKRKRTHPQMETATRGHQSPFNSPNLFEELSHSSDDYNLIPASVAHGTTSSEHTTQPRVHKPPAIYVYCVINYRDMVKYLTETLEEEQYYCKALQNEMVKINVNTSDS